MLADIPELNAAYNGAVIIGYRISVLAFEGEFSASLLDGETTFSGIDWDVTTSAVYLVLRSPGSIYLKLKGGYLNEEVRFTGNSFAIDSKDSGASYGVGVGARFANDSRLEFEYALVEEDISFLSLGYLF